VHALAGDQPIALVLAGHNGSGKSTLWNARLADLVKIPLANADRLTLSLLPPPGTDGNLRPWAIRLRDEDERWQRLSQESVRLFLGLAMEHRMPFAFETVFSYLKQEPNGSWKSKIEIISQLQDLGYYVILLFVGLTNADLSLARVATRRLQGGHDVPVEKLRDRFPRTQQAIRMASAVADLTVLFDNSRDLADAFTLVRAQQREKILYDCRDTKFAQDPSLLAAASGWLAKVAPLGEAV